jgi:hypothetical protein
MWSANCSRALRPQNLPKPKNRLLRQNQPSRTRPNPLLPNRTGLLCRQNPTEPDTNLKTRCDIINPQKGQKFIAYYSPYQYYYWVFEQI